VDEVIFLYFREKRKEKREKRKEKREKRQEIGK
jgi:hypothetical protein